MRAGPESEIQAGTSPATCLIACGSRTSQTRNSGVKAMYRPGDSLVWTHRDTAGYATVRPVRFLGLRSGGHRAEVSFGPGNNHTIPLSELSLPGPPEKAWWIPPRIEVPPPPTPPTPPSDAEIASKIAERRAALRVAFDKSATAAELVATALKVADRARQQRDDARMALARARAAERQAADDFEQAIRKGEEPPPRKNGYDRAGLESQCALAEQSLEKFARELSVANAALAERLTEVRRAAEGVVAAILEKEAEHLRRIEAEAARCRAELVAARAVAAKLAPAAAQLLDKQPDYTAPPASTLAAPWKALLERLIDDAEAELQDEAT
jgi:hypothetical protein